MAVIVHFARDVARCEIWLAGGEWCLLLGKLQDVVGAVAHAQAAADSGA